MRIQQKQVTIVNLQDGRPRDFVLIRDQEGYRLAAVAEDEVVNVLLSDSDLQTLRQELAKVIECPLSDGCDSAPKPHG